MTLERNISRPRVFLGLIAAVAGWMVGLLAGSMLAAEQNPVAAGKVAALVNGEPIYEEQLKSEVAARLASFRKFGMRKDDADLLKRLQLRALDKVIGERLIYQESQKLTIEQMDEKVEQRVKALERKYGRGEPMERYLKMRHLTMEGLKESFRKKVCVDEYLAKQGISEPEIAEERIRDVYESDPASFSRVEETVRVSHILIAADKNAGEEQRRQARQEAERVRKEILDGKDFAEMAKQYSDCNSASGGGELEYMKRGYMPEEFDRVAFSMETDAISAVVETKFGYHIIKLSDKKPAGVVPYEDVREFIKKYLQEEESKTKLAAHIAELKSKAKIEILLQE